MTTKMNMHPAEDAYTVKRTKYGVALYGRVPLSDMVAFMEMYKKQGLTVMAPGIAVALKATMAFTADDASHDAWKQEIEARLEGIDDKERRWINGTDTGISSRTIFSVLSEKWGAAALGHWGPDAPYDPADFGRCHRLLELMPEWRGRLHKVAEKYPMWKDLVDNWTELTATYLEELPSGKCPRLYQRLQELRGEKPSMGPRVTFQEIT